MALAGGLFTFLNGRLNEAGTRDARERVIVWTLAGLSAALTLCGFAASIIGFGLWSLAIFLVAFIFQTTLFIRQPGPMGRIEIVSFCILCCTTTTLFISIFTLHFFERHLKVTSDIIDLLNKMNRP
jgi:hypothetical protein